MGKPTGWTSSGYGHRIQRIGRDHFRLFWTFDRKIAGSRLRWPTTVTRDTDEAGAKRYAKKWGAKMPEAPAAETPSPAPQVVVV